jgi:hypothetical protein
MDMGKPNLPLKKKMESMDIHSFFSLEAYFIYIFIYIYIRGCMFIFKHSNTQQTHNLQGLQVF